MAESKTKKEPKFVEVRGIRVAVDEDIFNDIEILDMFDELDSGNVLKLPKLLKRIFGDKWHEISKRLANKNGRVPADTAAKFLADVMDAAGLKK